MKTSLLVTFIGLASASLSAPGAHATTTGTWTFTTNVKAPTCDVSAADLLRTIPITGAAGLTTVYLDGLRAGADVPGTVTDWTISLTNCQLATGMKIVFNGTPSSGSSNGYATGIDNLAFQAWDRPDTGSWNWIKNGYVGSYTPGPVRFRGYLVRVGTGATTDGDIKSVINLTVSYY